MPIDPEIFKSRDAGSYDEVADRFDYWTERVTSPLARELVEIAHLGSGERVLDVGTGSGVVAFEAARKVGATGQTVAIDLSEGMLRVARGKVSSPGTTQFLRMDAEHLKFQSASFDVALSLYALLHFPHPELAIREMFRVVRPGGRVVIGIGTNRKLSWRHVALLWGRLKEGRNRLAAPKALDEFIENRLPDASDHETAVVHKADPLDGLLYKAGFRGIYRYSKSYTHRIDTAADFWDLQTTFSSVVRKRLENAPREIRDRLELEFCAKCDAVLGSGGRLLYRNGATILSATRP